MISVCVCVRVGSLHPSVINTWRHVQLRTRRMRFGAGQLSEGGSHAVDTVNLEVYNVGRGKVKWLKDTERKKLCL